MLQFLNPIWLFGISAVLIPLIIHLWNIKTGKTLKVGSIVLMCESSRQNSRSLKLTDLLLLFLRCLIIIILSTLLAEPVWKSRNSKEQNNAWILAERDNLAETYTWFKKEIDSLYRADAEFHFFEPGFPEAQLTDALKDSALVSTIENTPYWSLLKLLDQKIPKTTKAYLFTNDRLNRFSGPRPELSAGINWKTYTPADSTSRWIESAYLSTSGGIRTTLAESSPAGIIRKIVNLDVGSENSEIKITIRDGIPVVQLSGQQVTADTASLRIAVYSDFPGDEGYVLAAVKAIQSYSSRKIKLVAVNTNKDFLFWLSAKHIPEELLRTITPGGTVLTYAKGKTTAINSWIETQTVSLAAKPPSIYQRITHAENPKSSAVWEDGFGTPLLDLTTDKNISTYTLYTRLNPQWTDLVWNPDFVNLLMPLIIPGTPSAQQEKLDKRRFSGIQMSQVSNLRPQTSGINIPTTLDLKYYLWILLILSFLTERWLSFKTNRVT